MKKVIVLFSIVLAACSSHPYDKIQSKLKEKFGEFQENRIENDGALFIRLHDGMTAKEITELKGVIDNSVNSIPISSDNGMYSNGKSYNRNKWDTPQITVKEEDVYFVNPKDSNSLITEVRIFITKK